MVSQYVRNSQVFWVQPPRHENNIEFIWIWELGNLRNIYLKYVNRQKGRYNKYKGFV